MGKFCVSEICFVGYQIMACRVSMVRSNYRKKCLVLSLTVYVDDTISHQSITICMIFSMIIFFRIVQPWYITAFSTSCVGRDEWKKVANWGIWERKFILSYVYFLHVCSTKSCRFTRDFCRAMIPRLFRAIRGARRFTAPGELPEGIF